MGTSIVKQEEPDWNGSGNRFGFAGQCKMYEYAVPAP